MNLKRLTLAAAFIVALLVLVSPSLAARVHFVGQPTFTDLGTTLQTCGSIAGLGNEDVTVIVEAVGTATGVCINPGGHEVESHRIEQTVTGEISNLRPENGRVNFCVTTEEPGPPDPTQFCPNPNWQGIITDVDFDSVTITVIQGGVIVLQRTFNP